MAGALGCAIHPAAAWLGFIWHWRLSVLILALSLAVSGCARMAARGLATAPNRYPRWLAPPGRTFLSYPESFLTNFPPRRLVVGPPPAELAYRVVPPADYRIAVTVSNWHAHGRVRQSFHFTAQFPAPPNNFTQQPRGTIFILHGYGGDLTSMMPLALRLAQEGWQCVVPDLRGHGESSGREISYGVADGGDLSSLLNHLASDGPTGPVAVVGHSYGAVVGLRWAATDSRVKTAVALAPYAQLRDAALNIRQEYSPWFPECISRSGVQALPGYLGLSPVELDPTAWLERTPVTALFIVGLEDKITPPLDSSRLRTRAKPDSSTLFVPGANHETVPYVFDPVLTATAAWLAAHVRGAGS